VAGGARHDIAWDNQILGTPRSQFAALAVQRSPRQGAPEEIALMARPIPPATQALAVVQRLGNARQFADGLEQALEAVADGVLLLDSGGAIVHANRAARSILKLKAGIAVREDVIEFTDPAAVISFRTAMRAILDPGSGDGSERPGADFVAARPDDLPPLAVSLRSIDARDRGGAAALLFIHDPLVVDTGASLLQAAFGLTPAEAHLAVALRRGVSPQDYARERGISRNTVYTHLRRIKDKCRQGRLPELVRLLNNVHTIASPLDQPPA
jgi:DNA-binding CsgD family transcriptional regulator